MNGGDAEHIFARAKRATEAMQNRGGPGFSYSAVDSAGAAVHYSIHGISSPESYMDRVANLVNWIWTLHGRLRRLFRANQLDPNLVDQAVANSRALQICRELRNLEEHGPVTTRRRGGSSPPIAPRFGVFGFAADQRAFGLLAQTPGNHFGITLSNQEFVELHAPVEDEHGALLGDAVAICNEAMDDWKRLIQTHGLAAQFDL